MSDEKKTQMLDDERGQIVLEATWEIDALVLLIGKAIDGDMESGELFAIKGVMKRVRQLNSVIMSAIGDPMEDNESLRKMA